MKKIFALIMGSLALLASCSSSDSDIIEEEENNVPAATSGVTAGSGQIHRILPDSISSRVVHGTPTAMPAAQNIPMTHVTRSRAMTT